MAKNKIIKELQTMGDKLPALIEAHSVRIDELAEQMAELDKAGLIYAAPHWREGKYFYLVYPVKSGDKRRRDYIGTDTQKIEDAQAAIARGKAYDVLAAQHKRYEGFLIDTRRVLKVLVDDMTRQLK